MTKKPIQQILDAAKTSIAVCAVFLIVLMVDLFCADWIHEANSQL